MTLYQPGFRGILDVGYGLTGQIITCLPQVGGSVVDVSSATVDILRPGESMDSPTVDGAAATEDSTTHLLTYTLDASNTGTWFLGDGYVALFKYTAATFARTQRVGFEVVRVPLTQLPPCNTQDVLNVHPFLTDALVQDGIVDANSDADASRFIVEAWGEIVEWLRARGRIPGRITSPAQLTPWVRAAARIKALLSVSSQSTDLTTKLIAKEDAIINESISNMKLYYDVGDVGSPSNASAAFIQPRMLPLRRGLRRLGVVK